MKILVLNGSPRPKGNTAAMVNAFKTGAEKNGNEVVVMNIGTMNIKGCVACEYCHTKGAGACIQKDDMQNVYPEIASADVIIFASPVYYFGFSGQMETALSRFYCVVKPAKAKKFGLIISSGSPNVYAGIEAQFEGILAFWEGENIGVCTAAGEENGKESTFAKLMAFGKSIK